MPNTYLRPFRDICEWVNYAENDTPACGPDETRSAKIKHSPSWNGVHSFTEAFDTMRNGWPEGLARMKKVLDCVRNLVRIETPVYQFHDDVEGMAPNVENYIMGLPEDMHAMEAVRMDAPPSFTTIQFELAVSCSIEADQLTWAAATLFAAIEAVRVQGCKAEILLSFSIRGQWGDMWMMSVPIPDTLDMDTLAFLFTHPACLRTVGLSTMEHEDEEIRQIMKFYNGGAYGWPTLVKDVRADVYLRAQEMCPLFWGTWDEKVKIAQGMLNKLVDTKFQSFQ